MNKQSNVYTVVYASVMVIIVAAVLAFTALTLKPAQEQNVKVDKMKQILSSVYVSATSENAEAQYNKYIVDSYVMNENGDRMDGTAFSVDMAVLSKQDAAKRQLPVFICKLDDGSQKYILPMYGSGLWGPIWGYVSLDENGNTVYGAYFSHKGETPGLGAEISTPIFTDQYKGKQLFVGGIFKSIAVEKAGQKAIDGAEQVDAISGGTITSKGVQEMMMNCIAPYQNFLKSLN